MKECRHGHPFYDARYGCGPCKDEMDAGYGDRPDAMPLRPVAVIQPDKSRRGWREVTVIGLP